MNAQSIGDIPHFSADRALFLSQNQVVGTTPPPKSPYLCAVIMPKSALCEWRI